MLPGPLPTLTTWLVLQPDPFVYIIVAVPVPIPVIVPVPPLPLAIATDVLSLLHVPPGVALVIITDDPTHMLDVPLIDAGDAFTVTTRVLTQPSQLVKLIVAVPAPTPVSVPVLPGPTPDIGADVPVTVAIAVLLLLQLPQPALTLSEELLPAHTVELPLIEPAALLTVTITLTEQPLVDVNVIDAVPALTPLTTPDDTPTVATLSLPLLHAPPPLVALLRLLVEPVHKLRLPVIADGSAFTTIDFVT